MLHTAPFVAAVYVMVLPLSPLEGIVHCVVHFTVPAELSHVKLTYSAFAPRMPIAFMPPSMRGLTALAFCFALPAWLVRVHKTLTARLSIVPFAWPTARLVSPRMLSNFTIPTAARIPMKAIVALDITFHRYCNRHNQDKNHLLATRHYD